MPFLEIPVQKSLNFAKNAVAKINVPSLVLTGLLVLISAVVIPSALMLISKKLHFADPFTNHYNSTYRNLDLDISPMWKYGSILDNVLLENHIDTTACVQRSICSLIYKSKRDILNGNATSIDKIIDGVTSNDWILDKIYSTSIYSAVNNGLNSVNCNKEYTNCKIPENNLISFINDAIQFLGTI
ncbi:uncharacterized protein LOC126887453 [Diabrotica virgifera virgifera]|uniref:Uncharacterized protein n=1 Tax=Diabrotica virgifera virgifera TaxID=50390 RepID=A0ABM5KL77_DIAVI|nr:uncharacterized protein LOC126887453 [Diabrotica virgifera virgifera]